MGLTQGTPLGFFRVLGLRGIRVWGLGVLGFMGLGVFGLRVSVWGSRGIRV